MPLPSYDASTTLFDDGAVAVGTFDCRPQSPMWREPEHVSDGCVFVFPSAPVLLDRGAEQLLADRSRVVFHYDGAVYRRRLAHAEEDRCLFVRVELGLVGALLNEVEPEASRPPGRELPLMGGHIDDATYAQQRLLRAALEGGGHLSRRALHESVSALLRRSVAACLHSQERRLPVPSPAHRALAEEVRLAVGMRLHGRTTLADAGERVGYSPYHLARVFRSATGMSIQHYRLRLRLRAAFDRVVAGEPDLSTLADDLGFSSHSHLTDRFHRAFGVTPTALRRTPSLPLR